MRVVIQHLDLYQFSLSASKFPGHTNETSEKIMRKNIICLHN